ncbi:hypothetical protein JNW90_19795 [Micromonospora sp. STR1s_5]|nr:hypothetical protein [Micromonospora sp. STR1s_5]
MVDHKMIVIDDVRYRLEDAKERGLVDASGKLTRKARSARQAAARQRVTGDESLGEGAGLGGVAGAGDGKQGAGSTPSTTLTTGTAGGKQDAGAETQTGSDASDGSTTPATGTAGGEQSAGPEAQADPDTGGEAATSTTPAAATGGRRSAGSAGKTSGKGGSGDGAS